MLCEQAADDGLVGIQQIGAVERIADHRAESPELVAPERHGRQVAIDHCAHRVLGPGIDEQGVADQQAIHRQLATVNTDDQHSFLFQDMFHPAPGP